jgi:hypothetical protein
MKRWFAERRLAPILLGLLKILGAVALGLLVGKGATMVTELII